MNTPDYLRFLEKSFTASANPAEAVKLKKYMKDLFDYYGVKSPERKKIYKQHKLKYGLIPASQKTEIVKWCWNVPQREWQYFAMEFLGKEAKKVTEEKIELYEFMLLSKSWWDTVDFIAANLVGAYFQKYPDQIPLITEKWMDSGNIWLQRTCLLFQLKYRKSTNTDLLSGFIQPLSGSNEFFIRKAIGWALREYSKTNPDFVIQYVKNNHLSGLSKREALKWLHNRNMI